MIRLLISRHKDKNRIQDLTRKRLFEKETVMEFSHPETDDEMFEVIRGKKMKLDNKGEMMICIDNFQCKCNTVIQCDSKVIHHDVM